MMTGVPEVARNRNAVEGRMRIEPTMATSDLNQRFSKSTMNKPVSTPKMMDGSLTDKSVRPKIEMLAFCTK